jgi:hypothetical protein
LNAPGRALIEAVPAPAKVTLFGSRARGDAEEVRALPPLHVELLERADHARLVTGDAQGVDAAQQRLVLDNYNEGLWRLAMPARS